MYSYSTCRSSTGTTFNGLTVLVSGRVEDTVTSPLEKTTYISYSHKRQNWQTPLSKKSNQAIWLAGLSLQEIHETWDVHFTLLEMISTRTLLVVIAVCVQECMTTELYDQEENHVFNLQMHNVSLWTVSQLNVAEFRRPAALGPKRHVITDLIF